MNCRWWFINLGIKLNRVLEAPHHESFGGL